MIDNNIVLFDGICNLCNSYIQFLIKQDTSAILKFAALQSKTGQQFLIKYQLPIEKIDSIIFIKNGRAYTHSTAVLQIAKNLGLGGGLVSCLQIIPKSIRDKVYHLIAHHRYRFLGKKTTCLVPTPVLKARFLE